LATTLDKGKAPNFFICFGVTILISLMFNPGTSGINLPDFSTFGLVCFTLVMILSLAVLFAPLFLKFWSKTIGKAYLFLFVVFVPVDSIYLYKSIEQLLR